MQEVQSHDSDVQDPTKEQTAANLTMARIIPVENPRTRHRQGEQSG